MPNTTSSTLPYPASSDAPNGPSQIQALATTLDRKVLPPFASITARNTAIPSPIQGQSCTVLGALHTYDGSAWRWVRRGFVNATSDVNGNITVAHSLGVTPVGVLITPAQQATNLLDRIITFSYTTSDASNFVAFVRRTDTSAAVPSTQVQFAWEAFT